jgi:hypothetical protein
MVAVLATACTQMVGRRTVASTVADVSLALVTLTPVPYAHCEITNGGEREQGCWPSLAFGMLGAAALLTVAGLAGLLTLGPPPQR